MSSTVLRWCVAVLFGIGVAHVSGQAAPRSLEDLYERVTELSDRDDRAGLQVLLDSLSMLPGRSQDERLFDQVLRADMFRRKGELTRAYWRLDSLMIDTTAHHLVRFLHLKYRAQVFKAMGMYSEALAESVRAQQLAKASGMLEEWIDCLITAAENKRKMDDYSGAMHDLNVAEREAGKLNYAKGLCNVTINRGNLYYFQDRYDEALERYREAYTCAVALGSPVLIGNAMNNIGGVLSFTKGPKEAIAFYSTVLQQSSVRMDRVSEASVRANIGNAYNDLGDHHAAREHLTKALQVQTELGDTAGMLTTRNYLSKTYWELGLRDSALQAVQRTLDLSRAIGSLEVMVEAQGKLQEYHEEMGHTERALVELKRFHLLKDSLSDIKHGRMVRSLEIQFGTEKKEQALKLREAELEEERGAKQRRGLQRNILVGIVAALVAIGVLGYRSMLQKRALAEQQRTISEQRVEHVLREQELRLVNAMVEGQDRERKRIAQDLHDRLGSMLSAIKLQFSTMEPAAGSAPPEHHGRYGKVMDLLDDAVGEVRRISHDMERGSLAQFGLMKALDDLRETIRVPGLEVEVSSFGLAERLPHKIEIAIYRIVQELVNNALKHARATSLSIQVTRVENALNLIVEDNGRGFTHDEPVDGMGLSGLHQRVAALGGKVNIDTKIGRGTSVSVDIPLG